MSDDRILSRIRKLLERANHPNTPDAERDSCLAKADAMMVKHAIDEALFAAALSPEERRKPVTEKVQMYDPNTVHGQRFRTILVEVCRTVRVRVAGSRGLHTLVGFRDDVEYAQLLFTTIQYAFVAKIKPTWNPELPVGANVYAFKAAGYDWASIYAIANRNGVPADQERETLWSPYDTYVRKNDLTKVKTNRFGAYRDSFADAFVNRICSRLEDMREAAGKQAAGSGAELALVSRSEDVDEEFYRLFPHARPLSPEEMERIRQQNLEEDRLRKEALEARLAAMSPRERAAYEREQQEERRRQAREDDKWWRQYQKEQAAKYDSAGMRAGAAAADSVNLSRSNPAAQAANRKAL